MGDVLDEEVGEIGPAARSDVDLVVHEEVPTLMPRHNGGIPTFVLSTPDGAVVMLEDMFAPLPSATRTRGRSRPAPRRKQQVRFFVLPARSQ
jgi:hypothetical protein